MKFPCLAVRDLTHCHVQLHLVGAIPGLHGPHSVDEGPEGGGGQEPQVLLEHLGEADLRLYGAVGLPQCLAHPVPEAVAVHPAGAVDRKQGTPGVCETALQSGCDVRSLVSI